MCFEITSNKKKKEEMEKNDHFLDSSEYFLCVRISDAGKIRKVGRKIFAIGSIDMVYLYFPVRKM